MQHAPTGVAGEGECFDSRWVGLDVNVSGIVTGKLTDKSGFFLQQNASRWSGLFVSLTYCQYADRDCADQSSRALWKAVSLDVPSGTGDRVQVTGTVVELNGTTTLGSVSSVRVVESGVAHPSPLNVTTGALGGNCSYGREAYEGVLVDVREATFGEDDGSRTRIAVDDGTGPLQGKTNAFPYDLDTLRSYYGITSLEGNVLSELRGE